MAAAACKGRPGRCGGCRRGREGGAPAGHGGWCGVGPRVANVVVGQRAGTGPAASPAPVGGAAVPHPKVLDHQVVGDALV
jgi:hypothetical protein